MRSTDLLPPDGIVRLYRDALGATLDDPEQFLTTLTERVRDLLAIVGLVLVAEPRKSEEGFRKQIETIESIRMREGEGEDLVAKNETGWINTDETHDMLAGVMSRGIEHITRILDKRFPERIGLITHWVTIDHTPRIAICFFRPHLDDSTHLPFTTQEVKMIQQLTPHLSYIVRIHVDTVQSRRAGFDFFAERCHEIATQFGLTMQEFRVLRKLVAGASNAVISQETGTTPATVKTHITHILQKTGCRNRSALIGEHFSSRSTVKL